MRGMEILKATVALVWFMGAWNARGQVSNEGSQLTFDTGIYGTAESDTFRVWKEGVQIVVSIDTPGDPTSELALVWGHTKVAVVGLGGDDSLTLDESRGYLSDIQSPLMLHFAGGTTAGPGHCNSLTVVGASLRDTVDARTGADSVEFTPDDTEASPTRGFLIDGTRLNYDINVQSVQFQLRDGDNQVRVYGDARYGESVTWSDSLFPSGGDGTYRYNEDLSLAVGSKGTVTFADNSSASLKSLAIERGGKAALLSTGLTLATGSLSISDLDLGTTLDVSNGQVKVMDGGLTSFPGQSGASLVADIASGYNGGDWCGAGITSSSAAADLQHTTGVGYRTEGSGLLIRYTRYGDANLDGQITADDFALIDRSYSLYQQGLIGAGLAIWSEGDFNYDGAITAADYLLIDRAFALQAGGVGPALLALRESEFGEGYVAALTASLPEPAFGGVFGAATLAMGRRRRHQVFVKTGE